MMILSTILTNKSFLYGVLFFSICNIIGYISLNDFDSIILFISIGVLTTFFSKNMSVVLLTSMFVTNILFASNRSVEFFTKKN